MSYIVIVQENKDGVANLSGVEVAPATAIERYRQEVDVLDLGRIIAAVNHKPRVRRAANKAKVQAVA
jgi:hypothetical protein